MKKFHRGFTLVETAIVIAIVGVLASLTLVVYNNVQKQSRDSKRTNDMKILSSALEKYHERNGEYPMPPECNSSITSCNPAVLSPLLTPKYITKIPQSPSGASYEYVRAGWDPDQYALFVHFETQSSCKTGDHKQPAWFNSAPECTF